MIRVNLCLQLMIMLDKAYCVDIIAWRYNYTLPEMSVLKTRYWFYEKVRHCGLHAIKDLVEFCYLFLAGVQLFYH
jgi:hypothetical protein